MEVFEQAHADAAIVAGMMFSVLAATRDDVGGSSTSDDCRNLLRAGSYISSVSEFSVNFAVHAIDLAGAGEGDEFDALGVAGFEAHGGPSGYVEAEAAGNGAVKP